MNAHHVYSRYIPYDNEKSVFVVPACMIVVFHNRENVAF